MIAQKTVHDFGFKKGDTHIVVSAFTEEAQCYDSNGVLIVVLECLPMGSQADWKQFRGDTPPGIYKLGTVYRDFERYGMSAPRTRETESFGWYTFDMESLWMGEIGTVREGICAHGGGGVLGWPTAWEPYQPLVPPHGCVRFHNADLRDYLIKWYDSGTVFVTVVQDNK